nr:hypothetical protein GCM10025732_08810 [Glycomyces mayteni]
MADRDGAALRVDDLGVEAGPGREARERLRRIGLVELHGVEVVPADPGAFEGAFGGGDRPDAVPVRLDGGDRAGDDARQGPAVVGRGPFAAEEERGGAVAEGAGVPGGDGAAGAERGPEPGEDLGGGRGADRLVAVEFVQGQDLVGEGPGLPRGVGEAVAAGGEGVLGFAADAELVGEDLGPFAEAHGPLRVHGGVDQAPAEGGVGEFESASRERLLGLREDPRGAAHRLDAPGDDEVGVAALDRAGRGDDGFGPGPAEAVDGGARDGRGEPGEEDGHAGDVAVVLARAVGVAEDDVPDRRRVEVALARDEPADRLGGQVVGADLRERAAVAADRGADGVEDVGGAHGGPRGSRKWSIFSVRLMKLCAHREH